MQFAAVFPGQGSQSLGMLEELSGQFSQVKTTFQEGSDLLGKDLWALRSESSDGAPLNQTENTQPVMLAAGIAVWRVWQSQGGCQPVGMAGHSLGEYSALVAAGILDYGAAIKLVGERARLMQQAVPDGSGAMAAVLGLDDDIIIKICGESSQEGVVEAVNFNSPGQVVIAGEALAVDHAMEALTQAGAKRVIKLAVSVPSHCSLMKNAAEQLKKILKAVEFQNISKENEVQVLQNVEAKSYASCEDIQLALSKQLYKPVMWVDTINQLHESLEADTIIEFGPGKVLFGLNRRINRKLGNICVHDLKSIEKALEMCQS